MNKPNNEVITVVNTTFKVVNRLVTSPCNKEKSVLNILPIVVVTALIKPPTIDRRLPRKPFDFSSSSEMVVLGPASLGRVLNLLSYSFSRSELFLKNRSAFVSGFNPTTFTNLEMFCRMTLISLESPGKAIEFTADIFVFCSMTERSIPPFID